MTLAQRGDWTQEGAIPDANGEAVRAYDDVSLLRSVARPDAGNVSVTEVPAGSRATVLFFTREQPHLLDLECYVAGGYVFAKEDANFVTLAARAEDKSRRGIPQ